MLQCNLAGSISAFKAVSRGGCSHHYQGTLTVAAIESLVQVCLLTLGGHSRGGAHALDIHDDEGRLHHVAKPDALLHEREAGARRRRHGLRPRQASADEGTYRTDLILELDRPHLGPPHEILQNLGGRGDGIAGEEGHARGDGPLGDGFVALHEPFLCHGRLCPLLRAWLGRRTLTGGDDCEVGAMELAQAAAGAPVGGGESALHDRQVVHGAHGDADAAQFASPAVHRH